MNLRKLMKEAHKRAKSQFAIYATITRMVGKFSYRSLLAEKMKDIYYEVKTGMDKLLAFQSALSYNP